MTVGLLCKQYCFPIVCLAIDNDIFVTRSKSGKFGMIG